MDERLNGGKGRYKVKKGLIIPPSNCLKLRCMEQGKEWRSDKKDMRKGKQEMRRKENLSFPYPAVLN